MKMYTEAGNAKRAAKAIADKHQGVLLAAPSVRAHTAQPMFYPAVMFDGDHELALRTKLQEDLADVVKFVNASEQLPDDDKPNEVIAHEGSRAAQNGIAPKPAKSKTSPKATKSKAPAKTAKVTKTSTALALMSRKGGVTAKELIEELGWLPHTLRGFISLQNSKEDRGIVTERNAGVTTYYIEQPDAE